MNLSGNITSVILRRTLNSDLGEVSLDSQMLSVLMLVDGVKTVGDIAKRSNIDMHTLKEILLKLDKLNLIEADVATVPTLDEEFFEFLTKHLIIAMGPMAEIIIDDVIRDMGIDRNKIPTHKAAELVDILAREILRNEKRVQFQQTMIKKIKNI
jgi:hypothetical protein